QAVTGVPGARRVQRIDADWWRAVAAQPVAGGPPDATLSPDDPVRLGRTSGTTGMPKRLMLTRRMHAGRVGYYLHCETIAPDPRYLIAAPFVLGAVYTATVAFLVRGATLIVETRKGAAQAIIEHGVTHVSAMPLQLQQMLDSLPPDYARQEQLLIYGMG